MSAPLLVLNFPGLLLGLVIFCVTSGYCEPFNLYLLCLMTLFCPSLPTKLPSLGRVSYFQEI